jgi:hypothetical protein
VYSARTNRFAVATIRNIRELVSEENFEGGCTFTFKESHQRGPWPSRTRKEIEYFASGGAIQRLTQPSSNRPIGIRAFQDHLQRVDYFAAQKIRKPGPVVDLEKLESHLLSRARSPQPENSAPPGFSSLTLRAGDHRLRGTLRLVLRRTERVASQFHHLL